MPIRETESLVGVKRRGRARQLRSLGEGGAGWSRRMFVGLEGGVEVRAFFVCFKEENTDRHVTECVLRSGQVVSERTYE